MSATVEQPAPFDPLPMREWGGPAFPGEFPAYGGVSVVWAGMSLRDYFAAKAMASILYETIKVEGDATTHRVARDAYRVADAMLKAREA